MRSVVPAFERSLRPLIDVASIVEAGFHPKMRCNDLSRTHADVVYSTAFRRRESEQRGSKTTISGIFDGISLYTKTGTSCLFKSPMNPQYYRYSNLCTLYPSNLQLVV